jgi:hypothetical protein
VGPVLGEEGRGVDFAYSLVLETLEPTATIAVLGTLP